jgi:hypothetical protein
MEPLLMSAGRSRIRRVSRVSETWACVAVALFLGAAAPASAQSPGSLYLPASAAAAVAAMRLLPDPHQPHAAPRETQSGGSGRSSRGQSLTVTGNLQGGYDDNAGATPGSGSSAVPEVASRGSTGLVDGMFEYSRWTPRRQITMRTLGSLEMYPGYLDEPAATGKARISGQTALGRRNSLRFSAQVRFEPLFNAGFLEEVEDDSSAVDVAQMAPVLASGAVPTVALLERRSFVSSNKAYLERDWSRRDKTVVSYLYYTQHLLTDTGDNSYHQAAADYQRIVGRAMTLHAGYRYTTGQQTDSSSLVRPNAVHKLSGGLGFATRLAARRQLSVVFDTGATHTEQVHSQTGEPLEGWMPTGSASATLDLTRTWSFRAGYSRGFSMLQGLTGEFYATDRMGLSTEGRLMARTDLSAGATIADGRTLVQGDMNETFRLYGANLQVSVALTSFMAASAGYFYQFQRYSNEAALPPGFPARYERNAFAFGLTFWAPLAGALPARPRGPREW